MPKSSIYQQLSDTEAFKLCKAEGWDSLYCESCLNEIPRNKYAQNHFAYVPKEGGVFCYSCSHCWCCDEELPLRECSNSECELYLQPARKKDLA